MDELIKNVQLWLSDNHDQKEKEQVLWLAKTQNYDAVDDAFFRFIGFGKRGMFGKMGAGFNRINRFTVARVAQAYAQYLQRQFPGQDLSVVLAYDNRKKSSYFSRLASDIFCANNLKVYHFDLLTPAPVLAYSIRFFGCVGGVFFSGGTHIKEFNGIQLYDLVGSPLSQEALSVVESYMKPLERLNQFPAVVEGGCIEFVSGKIEQYYLRSLRRLITERGIGFQLSDNPIVYTPLCGTGIFIGLEALKLSGLQNVLPVDEEFVPSSGFAGVPRPDSQLESAFVKAISVAREHKAELILATDPDGGRAGMAIRGNENSYRVLKGYEVALVLLDYLIQLRKEKNPMGPLTMVRDRCTTVLLDKMAEKEGIKSISSSFSLEEHSIFRKRESAGRLTLAIDQEYGFFFSNHTFERDGMATAAFLGKAYFFWKSMGKSLLSRLAELFLEYGLYREGRFYIHYPGYHGASLVEEKIKRIRRDPFSALPGFEVLYIADYEEGKRYSVFSSEELNPLFQPKENRIHVEFEDNLQLEISFSPSEGKLDIFIGAQLEPDFISDPSTAQQQLEDKIKALKQQFLSI